MQLVFLLEQVVNGLVLGGYYLLIALGLSLIFSVGGIVNLAHGSFYAIGAYLSVEIAKLLGFGPAVVLSPVAVAMLGILFERFILRRFYTEDPILSLLVTFGLAMVAEQLIRIVWGAAPLPASMPAGLLQLEWCAMYSGAVRAALHALKYGGERRLAVPLATALAVRWRRAGRGGDVLTWVPVHASRRRERGFDQAEELARHMAVALDLPVAPLLERRQRTNAQHRLGRSQRVSNTRAAFAANSGLRGRYRDAWVVVVDDIFTTGATLGGCAQALLDGGAGAVSAATVARDR